MTASLACVTPYVPYDGIDHAGGAYLNRYLKVVVEAGWDVHVIAPDTRINRAVLDRATVEVELHPASGLGGRARFLVSSGVPARNGGSWVERLPVRSRAWLEQADLIDLQWADSLWQAPAIRRICPGARIMGLAHDVRTQSLERALRSGRGRARLEAVLALPAARRWETVVMNACDCVFVFKEADREALRATGVRSAIGLAPVPVAPRGSIVKPDCSSHRVLFSGAMFRPENSEAARWLLDEVWPHVRSQMSAARLRVAGARPPAWLRAYASGDIEVTGYLSDLSVAYEGVSCVAVPLRRGAGVKFKTVEAISAGYPVVSTSVGAEGVLDAAGANPMVITDDPVAFARALVEILHHGAPVVEAIVDDFPSRVRQLLDEGLRGS